MKFHFFYGRSPKLSQQDKDAFSGNGYKCEFLLQNKKGQLVSISHNEAQNVWRVAYGFSTMYFDSYAKAMEYCNGRFFNLDGKQV